jgi:hypothetical protein
MQNNEIVRSQIDNKLNVKRWNHEKTLIKGIKIFN